jgi:phage tail P2-like protein
MEDMRMNEHGMTTANLLRTLPEVLRNDDNMLALASSISDILSSRVSEIESLRIYTRIDELPEDLLDILAYDFKVDWYGYDYGIEAKRSLIKNSFNVHRHLGTWGAVEKALSDIYPGSEVEEWFEYGGDPFYFRVLLDVTNQRVAITHDEIIRTLYIYKSLRSHLQDNAVIYRSRVHIAIGVTCGYVVYGVRFCGTYPVLATQGDIESSGIDIGTDGGGVAYSTRICGTALGSII